MFDMQCISLQVQLEEMLGVFNAELLNVLKTAAMWAPDSDLDYATGGRKFNPLPCIVLLI